MKSITILVCSALAFFHAAAFCGDFYVAVDGGRNDLDLKPGYLITGTDDRTISGPSISVGGGYITDLNIVFTANRSVTTSDVLLGADDDYELSEARFLVGYQFPVAQHFRIVPNIGISDWDLTTREGALLNSGKQEKRNYKGHETIGQLNLEFPINHLVVVYTTYSRGNYDFGTSESLRAGVKFEF